MTTTQLRELPSFDNVSPGAKSTCKPLTTKAYEAFFLYLADTNGALSDSDIETYINRVRIRATSNAFGTITLWDVTGAQLVALNNFYGYQHSTGILPLIFAPAYMTTPQATQLFRLGTFDLTSLVIEVEWANGVTGPLELYGWSLDVAGANEELGEFIKLERNTVSNGTTGETQIRDLPVVGDGLGLKAMHIATDSINDVRIETGDTTLYEDDATVRSDVADYKGFKTTGRSQQSGYTHLDFAGNEATGIYDMTGRRDFTLTADFTATGTRDVVIEKVIGRFQAGAQ